LPDPLRRIQLVCLAAPWQPSGPAHSLFAFDVIHIPLRAYNATGKNRVLISALVGYSGAATPLITTPSSIFQIWQNSCDWILGRQRERPRCAGRVSAFPVWVALLSATPLLKDPGPPEKYIEEPGGY